MVRILFPPPLSLRTSVPLDRLDPASLPSAIRGTVDKFGRLDVLHNNAGGSNAQGLIDKPAGSLLAAAIRPQGVCLNSAGLDRQGRLWRLKHDHR
jgi:NAD(P)-dependent dehydrogenase (short-subunit alcohol dehydrogenase family)